MGTNRFTVVGSEVVVKAGFLEIERLEVEAPDGSRHDRNVVRHPGAVVVVAVEPSGERAILVRQYRASIDEVLRGLNAATLSQAVAIASIPEDIRGYGHVKARHLVAARAKWDALMSQWRSNERQAA